MKLDRVFVDTNVLFSAIGFDGNEREVVGRAIDGTLRLVLSDFVIREARRVLARKSPNRLSRFEWTLTILDYELVATPLDDLLETASHLVRDPGDAKVLAAILKARPEFALTGDKDLLTDEVKAVAPTCTCAEYLQRLREA